MNRSYHSLSDTEIEKTNRIRQNDRIIPTSVKTLRKELRRKFQQNIEQPESRSELLPNIINDIIFEDFIEPHNSFVEIESNTSGSGDHRDHRPKAPLCNGVRNGNEKAKPVCVNGHEKVVKNGHPDLYTPMKIRDELRLDLRKAKSHQSSGSSSSNVSGRKNKIFPIEEVSEDSNKSHITGDTMRWVMDKEKQDQIERVLNASRNCPLVRPVSRKPNRSIQNRKIAWPEIMEEQPKCMLELKLSRYEVDGDNESTSSKLENGFKLGNVKINGRTNHKDMIHIKANETNITIPNKTIQRLLLEDNYIMKIPIPMPNSIRRADSLSYDERNDKSSLDESSSIYRRSSFSTMSESFCVSDPKSVKKSKWKSYCCGVGC